MKELLLAVMFKDDKKRLLISYDNQSKKFFWLILQIVFQVIQS